MNSILNDAVTYVCNVECCSYFTHFFLGFITHLIGWVGPSTWLDGIEKRKISRLCRDLNPRQ